MATITGAFQGEQLTPALASSLMVLIPKVPHPTQRNQLRPISLNNMWSKLIAKIIVARLKPFLPSWINPVQSVFVPGRRSSDNIILLQEVIHNMHTKLCGKKVDGG